MADTTPLNNNNKNKTDAYKSNLNTPDVGGPNTDEYKKDMTDQANQMLQTQAWIQNFSIDVSLRSQEIKTLADALKGIIQKMN